jgi:Arc/MetJ family transcription regulator
MAKAAAEVYVCPASCIKSRPMRTNIEIDDELMAEAMRRSGLKAKKAVVEEALQTFVRLKRELDVLELQGIGWEGDLQAWRRDDDHDAEPEQ